MASNKPAFPPPPGGFDPSKHGLPPDRPNESPSDAHRDRIPGTPPRHHPPPPRRPRTGLLWAYFWSALAILLLSAGTELSGVPASTFPFYSAIVGFAISLLGVQYALKLRTLRQLSLTGYVGMALLILVFGLTTAQLGRIFVTDPESWQQFIDDTPPPDYDINPPSSSPYD